MLTRRLLLTAIVLTVALAAAVPARCQIYYDLNVRFTTVLTKDIVKLLPRAMGYYLYQNRWDFGRGITFMERQIRINPLKLKDLEEIKREAYARLSRDIPYCVQAFKGGDIKLDTSASNLAGRLGMIAYSIVLQKFPAIPDVEYLDRYARAFHAAVGEKIIDVWVYYDGYGDYHSLGELMERLQKQDMPTFRHVRNDKYPVRMGEDVYAMFRPPPKFHRVMTFTDLDLNDTYNEIVNSIVDTFVYIWKCSGMDLAHPSYAAPPGSIISRPSRRRTVTGGILARLAGRKPQAGAKEAAAEEEEELAPGFEEEEPLEGQPSQTPPETRSEGTQPRAPAGREAPPRPRRAAPPARPR
jgi:hypothetical protein